MAQKILFYAPFACSLGHHETDVEIASLHLKKGDVVHIVQCRRELNICDPNPTHARLTCLWCTSTSTRSFTSIGIPKSHLHALEIKERIPLSTFPVFASLQELKNYTYNGLPVGYGVACSTICHQRDTGPDMVKYQPFIHQTLAAWIETYNAITEHIKKLKPDLFYVFNGRIGSANAAYWAAKNLNIPLYTVDRESFKEYMLFENTINTDLPYIKKRMRAVEAEMYQASENKELAASWFTKNRKGAEEIIGHYLNEQKRGKLPADFDVKKRNIALFLSSEDELFIAPGWENPIYKNQAEAIRSIVAGVTDPEIHFYLRVHPNLKGLNNAQTREVATLHSPNMTVIPAKDAVDTYALLEACEKTITFGSTMGIEAVYWNRPSILVGRSFSEDLDAFYKPTSHEDLISLVQKRLDPKPRENALPFGFWMLKRGIPFQYVTARGNSIKEVGGINGNPLRPTPLVRIVLGFNNRLHRLRIGFRNLFHPT